MADGTDILRDLALERAKAILAEGKAAQEHRDATRRRKDVEKRIARLMDEIAGDPLPLFAGPTPARDEVVINRDIEQVLADESDADASEDLCKTCGQVWTDCTCPDGDSVPLGDEELTLTGSMVEGQCETCLQPVSGCMCPDAAESLFPGITDAIAENEAIKSRSEAMVLKMAVTESIPASLTKQWQESGADDDVLRCALREHWGVRGLPEEPRAGSGYVCRGGQRPAFWFGDATPVNNITGRFRKPDLIGQAVIDRVREAMGIGKAEDLEEPDAAETAGTCRPDLQASCEIPASKPARTHYAILRRRGENTEHLGDVEADYDGAALQEARKRWPDVPTREMEIKRFSGKPPKADRKPRKVAPTPELDSDPATFLVFKGTSRKPLYAIRARSLLDAIRFAKGRAGKEYSPRVQPDERGKAKSLALESFYAEVVA